jgi:hypothetical protein
MEKQKMLDPYIEIIRGAFLIGIVTTALLYERMRLLAGGAITASYVAYMLLVGDYSNVFGWVLLSASALTSIILMSRWLPLPKEWIFFIGVLFAATIHALQIALADQIPYDGFTTLLVAGLWITNGISAYDIRVQGLWKTIGAIALVILITLALLFPLKIWLENSGYFDSDTALQSFHMFVQHPPEVVIVTILAAAACRLSLGLGTAGIIGTLFLFQLQSVEAIFIILFFSIIGSQLFRFFQKRLGLTPRQELYAIFIVGGIVTWFGLFWATILGYSGAAIPSNFALEPLIIVPLMIHEQYKLGVVKALGGTAIVFTIIAIMKFASQEGGAPQIIMIIFVITAIALMFIPGFRKLFQDWRFARAAGKQHPILLPE